MATISENSSKALAIDCSVVCDLLCGFLDNEIHKVGFEKVVLGLSGGIDSALAAALACRVFEPENVVPILMPYKGSSPESESDARLICETLGMTPYLSDITPQIDEYFQNYPDADRSRRGNKMARERMSILYDMSWAHHALVMGTSNKTELLLGYGTIYGDMAHALNPLGDVYKTQVFALSEYIGIPEKIIQKAPSADLWEGQSDEEDLGFAYADVDALLYCLVDERWMVSELVAEGFDSHFVNVVWERVRANQYKRRTPLIAKLGSRTIEREFRYPRDWGT